MYPMMNSVNTFKPSWMFVTAWMIPIGMHQKRAMRKATYQYD